jgi:hypothetical protein
MLGKREEKVRDDEGFIASMGGACTLWNSALASFADLRNEMH